MKKLYLVRHAKSSWDNPNWTDFERPLNKRGLRDAPFMATKFAHEIHDIDLILSSPAKRAISTAECFAQALCKTELVIQEVKIYEANTAQLMEVIHALPSSANHVLLFGHNPGLSQLSQYLTGESMEMSTCSIAHIHLFQKEWKHVVSSCGKLVDFDYPKKYFA